jgi:hypothetical protein
MATRFQSGNSPLDFFGRTRLKKILHRVSVPGYTFRLKLSDSDSVKFTTNTVTNSVNQRIRVPEGTQLPRAMFR